MPIKKIHSPKCFEARLDVQSKKYVNLREGLYYRDNDPYITEVPVEHRAEFFEYSLTLERLAALLDISDGQKQSSYDLVVVPIPLETLLVLDSDLDENIPIEKAWFEITRSDVSLAIDEVGDKTYAHSQRIPLYELRQLYYDLKGQQQGE